MKHKLERIQIGEKDITVNFRTYLYNDCDRKQALLKIATELLDKVGDIQISTINSHTFTLHYGDNTEIWRVS